LGVLAVGAGLLLATFSPLFERFLGRKRLRFPYLARPIPAAQYAKLASKPGWQKAEVEVATGIELRGLLRRPQSAAAPWILFYPGNDESQLERGQRFLNLLAGELDWGLAVFPYRGYDASDGKAELAGIRADAPEVLSKFCAAERIQAMRVHLVGFSIGGHFAVHAAGGAAQRGQRARTLTLLAPAADIVMYTPSPWEKLSPGEDYQTVPFLGPVPEPVLIVQGSADSAFNGPQQGKAIAAALGKRARYVEIQGADHVPLLANELALEATRAFIQSSAD
jgi:pimeloyl-ACP methyl ester carboxylesterase